MFYMIGIVFTGRHLTYSYEAAFWLKGNAFGFHTIKL